MHTQPQHIARRGRLALGVLLVVALVGATSALALAKPNAGYALGGATPTPTATPTATPNPYDVNHDGVVDIRDVMLVAAAWEGN